MDEKQDTGAPLSGRATHEQSQQAVSAVPVGIPSADKTALSFWFPLVEAAGLPVPRTHILPMPPDAAADAWEVFDGKEPGAALEAFAASLRAAAKDFGTPFFLRSDHTSGKHEWDTACFVADPSKLAGHILGVAYYSELGWLRWDGNWVVREMLPTIPVATCPRFGNMPVCKEFRFFVDGPEIECAHPYWPRYALEQGGCDISDEAFEALCTPDNEDELRSLASRAGAAVGGRWSVDLLETERGWFLTDMAEAEKSFHWEGCPAQAIEARSGETGTGSTEGESAVGNADAPEPPSHQGDSNV